MLCEAVPNTYIRLGSLEPRTIDAEFCSRLQQYQNLRPHFHLSLQSGCDRILARMKRRYTAAFFAERCEMLRQSFPDCSITTDLIVGFPGETDTDFAQTLEFIRICDFSDIHVFPYSMRSGTPAADMPDQVPLAVKNHRAEQVKMIAAQMSKRYREKFVGRTLEVLFEHADGETWSGHSAYCFPVTAAGQQIQKNKFCQVHYGSYGYRCIRPSLTTRHKTSILKSIETRGGMCMQKQPVVWLALALFLGGTVAGALSTGDSLISQSYAVNTYINAVREKAKDTAGKKSGRDAKKG